MLRRSNLLSNDAEEAYIKAKLGFVYNLYNLEKREFKKHFKLI